jgi:hypothetical protein
MRVRIAALGLLLLMGSPGVQAGILGKLLKPKSANHPKAISPIFDNAKPTDYKQNKYARTHSMKLNDARWGALWNQTLFAPSHVNEPRHYLFDDAINY